MPQFTKNLGLAIFNVGDDLADLNNVHREMERFIIIDEQLHGLSSIFGNGVISGWEVGIPETQDPADVYVTISPGTGLIGGFSASTFVSVDVSELPLNSTQYIFVQKTGLTGVTRSADFVSRISNETSNETLLLATVTIGDTGVISVDNSVRTEIGFQDLINNLIAAHRHSGYVENVSPSKIDLDTETTGQLPGSKIANISADLITSGKIDPARLPRISHNDLTDRGVYTHETLDAIARTLSGEVDELIGEISVTNQLRDYIYQLTKNPDYIDWMNTLAIIPGITSDDLIDFDASTATINTTSGCISGMVVDAAETLSVQWNTQTSLENASYSLNADFSSVGVIIEHAEDSELIIDSFEATGNGQTLTEYESSVKSTDDNTKATGTTEFKTQGDYSGKFHVSQHANVTFTKTLSATQDWSIYNTLLIDVKCTTVSHGIVTIYLESSDGTKSSEFTILDADEVTSNPSASNFESRDFNISTFARTSVSKIVFTVQGVSGELDFWADNLRLKPSQSYKDTAVVRYRYNTDQTAVFNSLVTTTTEPTGTDVRVRIKVASEEADLETTLYTGYLPLNATFTKSGKWVEIEATLLSDSPNHTLTPILSGIELGLLVQSDVSGITVDTLTEWNRGTKRNVSISSTPEVTIKQINGKDCAVGDVSFISGNLINEIDSSRIPVASVTGSDLPPSEIQAWNKLAGNAVMGLTEARSAVRTSDRRWIVCDTSNHRIAVFGMNSAGAEEVINIYCGMDQDTDMDGIESTPLTATYNSNTGVLWLGFSKSITIQREQFSNIRLHIDGVVTTLSDEGSELSSNSVSGRVIGIALTTDHKVSLTGGDLSYVSYHGAISPTFPLPFIDSGIKVYIAPVSYYTNIWNPVYAIEKNDSSGQLWIANATYFSGTTTVLVPPVWHLNLFDPNTGTINHSNGIRFTTAYGGSILELSDGKVLATGVTQTGQGAILYDAFGPYPSFLYVSPESSQPTDIKPSLDGNYWVTESSATMLGGRILKIDFMGNIIDIFDGSFNNVNNIAVLSDGNILVSV